MPYVFEDEEDEEEVKTGSGRYVFEDEEPGLDHLEGKTVSVLEDGAVQAPAESLPVIDWSIFTEPEKEARKILQSVADADRLKTSPSVAYDLHYTINEQAKLRPEIREPRGYTGTWAEASWFDVFKTSIISTPQHIKKAYGGLIREIAESESPSRLQSELGIPKREPDKKLAEKGRAISLKADERLNVMWEELNIEDGSAKAFVGQATQSAINNLVYLVPTLVTKNPYLALSAMGLQAKGEAYHEQREGGSSPQTASLASLGYGVSEALTEFIPVGVYLKPSTTFMKKLVMAQMAEIPTEIVNTMVQDVIDKVTIRPDMTMADAIEHIYQTTVVTFLATPMLSGVAHVGNKLMYVPTHDEISQTDPEGQNPEMQEIKAKISQAITEGKQPYEILTDEERSMLINEVSTSQEQIAEHQKKLAQGMTMTPDEEISGGQSVNDLARAMNEGNEQAVTGAIDEAVKTGADRAELNHNIKNVAAIYRLLVDPQVSPGSTRQVMKNAPKDFTAQAIHMSQEGKGDYIYRVVNGSHLNRIQDGQWPVNVEKAHEINGEKAPAIWSSTNMETIINDIAPGKKAPVIILIPKTQIAESNHVQNASDAGYIDDLFIGIPDNIPVENTVYVPLTDELINEIIEAGENYERIIEDAAQKAVDAGETGGVARDVKDRQEARRDRRTEVYGREVPESKQEVTPKESTPPQIADEDFDAFSASEGPAWRSIPNDKVDDISFSIQTPEFSNENIESQIKKAFPNTDVKSLEDNTLFHVTLPNGKTISIEAINEIKITPAVKERIEKTYGRKLEPDELPAGRWQPLDWGGILWITKQSNQETVYHEAFHAAQDIVLTDNEIKTLEKKYGNREQQAEAYAKWNPQVENNTIFKRIIDFFRKLTEAIFGRSAESIFREVREGNIWDRIQQRTPSKGISFEIKDNLSMFGKGKPLHFDIKRRISDMLGLVQSSEAGRRVFTESAEGGAPEVSGISSSYPEFMRGMGWTGKQVEQALTRAIEGKEVTPLEKEIVISALAQVQEMYFDEIEQSEGDFLDVSEYIDRAEEYADDIISEFVRKIKVKKPSKLAEARAETRATVKELDRSRRRISELQKDLGEKISQLWAMEDLRNEMKRAGKEGKAEAIKKERERVRDYMQNRIDKTRERIQSRRLRDRIRKELKTTQVKKQGGKPVGKYTPEIQEVFELYRQASRYKRDAALEKINANTLEIQRRMEGQDPTDQRDMEDIALENRILQTVTQFRFMSVEELQEVIDGIVEMKQTGRLINELAKIKRKQDYQLKASVAVNVIMGGESFPEGMETTGVPEKKSLAAIQMMKDYLYRQVGWKDLGDILSKREKGSEPYRSRLSKIMNVRPETNARTEGRAKAQKDMINAIKRIYGLKSDHAMVRFINEGNKKHDLGQFTNLHGSDIKSFEFTKAEARKRWMELHDPTLENNFRAGMGYTDDMISAIREFLTPQDEEFVAWQLDFYQDYHPGINEVYRDLYGVNLPQNPHYSPLGGLIEGIAVPVEGGFGEFMQEIPFRAGVSAGSIKSRVEHTHTIKNASDLMIYQKHIAELEHFKTWAFKIKELRAVFGNVEVRNAIKMQHGKDMLFLVDNFMTDFTKNGMTLGQRIKQLDYLRGTFTRAVLAVKPSIMFKQLTSFIAYADSIPVTSFVSGVADFWFGGNAIKKMRFLYDHSTLLKYRGENQDRDIKLAQQSDKYRAFREHESLLNTLMLNVKVGDQGAIVIGGWSVYKYHHDKAIKAGKSEAEAVKIGIEEFEHTTESTQQSADLHELSVWQRAGSIAKLFTMFLSSPNQYMRREIAALRNLFARRGKKSQHFKTFLIYQFVLPMFFQWLSDFGTWDEDEQLRAVILGPYNSLFALGGFLEGVVRGIIDIRDYPDEIPFVGGLKDEFNKAWDLFDWDNLSTEEMLRAIRGLAGFTGGVTGTPLKTAVDITTGVDELLTGDFEKGLTQTLGWSPGIAEKATQNKGRR